MRRHDLSNQEETLGESRVKVEKKKKKELGKSRICPLNDSHDSMSKKKRKRKRNGLLPPEMPLPLKRLSVMVLEEKKKKKKIPDRLEDVKKWRTRTRCGPPVYVLPRKKRF